MGSKISDRPADVLARGLAKQAALDALHSRLLPENGGHRPLTAEELKVQRDNALTVAERDAVHRDLYAHWVAAEDLLIDNVIAFAAGHAVPTTHVERFGWDESGQVTAVEQQPAPVADHG